MSKKILYILIVLVIVVLIFSGVMIFKELSQSEKEKNDLEKLEDIVYSEIPSGEITITPADENGKEQQTASKRNLAPLFEQNPDFIGWIYIEGTAIDYPVMYTPQEPHKYLRKNFDLEYAISGVPFMEETITLEDTNIMIYGHNMKNGTMFSNLTKYIDQEYCKKHPIIEFETLEGVKYYEIFAVACIKEVDDWYYFDTAEDKEHYDFSVDDIKTRSLYETGIYPEYDKQVLTLSTCYGKANDDRLIVIGVLMDETA